MVGGLVKQQQVRGSGEDDAEGDASALPQREVAERFRYLYSEDELAELAAPIAEHLGEARETHLLMNNCYRDYSVRNADQMRRLLQRRHE